MAQYKVTATFLVNTEADQGQVRAEAVYQFRTLAREASAPAWDGVQATVTVAEEDVVIERLPDPEPLITMTRSQLEAEIAACVAQAIAAQNPDLQQG